MIACGRGDVVLVGSFSRMSRGSKVRPALVISSPAYQRARAEVIVAAITSNVRRRLFADHLLADWKAAGLLFPSVATAIVRTVKLIDGMKRLATRSAWWHEGPTLIERGLCRKRGGQPWNILASTCTRRKASSVS